MEKKNKSAENHPPENKSAAKRRPALQPVCLVLTSWQHWFSEEDNKIMIARALNYLTYHKNMCVKGYLIVSQRVFLVLDIEWMELSEMLGHLADKLQKEVTLRLHWLDDLEKEADSNWRSKEHHKIPGKIFRHYRLMDYDLINVLTGQYKNMGSCSSRQGKILNKLAGVNFCSVIDHSGAIGPVFLDGYTDPEYFADLPANSKK